MFEQLALEGILHCVKAPQYKFQSLSLSYAFWVPNNLMLRSDSRLNQIQEQPHKSNHTLILLDPVHITCCVSVPIPDLIGLHAESCYLCMDEIADEREYVLAALLEERQELLFQRR